MSKLVLEFSDEEVTKFLEEVEHSLFYHTPEYLRMISKILGATFFYIGVKYNNSINSLMPIMKKKSDLGVVYNSLAYYGSNGSVIQKSYSIDEKKILIKKFYKIAKNDGALSATIISNPLDGINTVWNDLKISSTDYRIGQITKLPQKPDALMKLFENPRPRNIRKAIKVGVEVAICHEEAIDFLHKTHLENMSSIGGLAKDKSFFESIPKYIPRNKWRIYVAKHNKKFISALLLFQHNATVEYFTPATIYDYRNFQPSALLIYNAMQVAVSEGFSYWNWGGTWKSQTGVYDFKKKWGAQDMRYEYFTQIFQKSVLRYSKTELMENFNGFYVLNFKDLEEL